MQKIQIVKLLRAPFFFFFFLFMSDAHHGINSSTQKYQSTQSSVVLTTCRQDSDLYSISGSMPLILLNKTK